MKEFLKILAAVLLGTILTGILGFFLILGAVSNLIRIGSDASVASIPDKSILYVSFEEGISTQDSDLPVLAFLPKELGIVQGGTSFFGMAQAIREAAHDPSVRLIYMDPQALNAQMSHIEEIRNALLYFRQSGKPVISYAGVYSQQAYYLATAADKIAIHPSGNIMLQGFSLTLNYYKDFFDRFGINVQWVRHGNYKTGGEMYTQAYMSKEDEKQLSSYMDGAWNHWEKGMEAMRHLEQGTINGLCNNSFLFSAPQANSSGLADEIWHRDEMMSYLSDVYEGIPEHRIPFVPLKKYIRYVNYNKTKKKFVKEKIATIYLKGEIVPGDNKAVVSSEPFAEQLGRYRRDSTVKAVVVRIESPGGDPMASDILAREIELTKKVKPVIVSMGDVAASGGYWISSGATEIFAEPFTMTGSIGVYSLYFNVEDAMNRLLNIHPQTIQTHPYGSFQSFYHKKSPAALDIIQESVNHTYQQFIETVSRNRNLNLSEVEALAHGRIWLGSQAVENGLADHIGGLTQAIDRAASIAGITQYRLVSYPKPMTLSQWIGVKGEYTGVPSWVTTLLKERGVRARLPFDEEALLW